MFEITKEGNVTVGPDMTKKEYIALELTRIWANNRNSGLVMYQDDIYNAYQYYIGLLREED